MMRTDLIYHLVVGALGAANAGALALAVGASPITAAFGGSILLALAGVAKELLWDRYLGRGTPAADDALVTAVGAVLGGLPFLLLI